MYPSPCVLWPPPPFPTRCYFIYFLCLCASVGASESEDTFSESVFAFYCVEAEVLLFLLCGILHRGMCYTVWYTPGPWTLGDCPGLTFRLPSGALGLQTYITKNYTRTPGVKRRSSGLCSEYFHLWTILSPLFVFFFFWDIDLYIPGWPGASYLAQAGLKCQAILPPQTWKDWYYRQTGNNEASFIPSALDSSLLYMWSEYPFYVSVYSDSTHMMSYTTDYGLMEDSLNKNSLHLQLRVVTGNVTTCTHHSTTEQTGRTHGGTENICREAVFCCTAAWQRLSKGKPVWLSSLAYCVELNPGPSSTLFFLTVTWLQAGASLFLMFLTGFTFREASARLKSRVELGPRKLTYLNFTLIYKTR